MTTRQAPAASGEPASRFRSFWRILRLVLIGTFYVAGLSLILLWPTFADTAPYDLQEGDIAPEDIRAPEDITYVSELETAAAQQAAAAAVEDIFDPPDPRIGRQQVRKAQQIMSFIGDVRADAFADDTLKKSYLNKITALELSEQATEALIHISDDQFALIEREVVTLIEEIMGDTVKEGQEDAVTSQLELKVSSDIPEDLIPVTVSIASDLIVANSALNVPATEAARAEAVTGVPAIRTTYQQGEVVIRAGDRVDELDLEALSRLGLADEGITWRDIASAIVLSVLSAVVLAMYLEHFDLADWFEGPGQVFLIVVLLLLFMTAAQFMVRNEGPASYLFPGAGLVLALTSLIGVPFAALMAIIMAVLVAYLAPNAVTIGMYTAVSGLLAAGSLRRTTRLNSFFLSGLAAAVGGMAVLLVFELPNATDPTQLAQLLLLAVVNGLLSAGVSLVILFVVGGVTGMTTSLKLIDLLRPDHPLQRHLHQEALGTYQHTLSVANLVETAAEAIGADSLLARVGSLYHDIGKTTNPGFFVENRTEGGTDPHKGLSPMASARTIRAHVSDGVDLARRHRLPPRIIDFIKEHHGTMPVGFFLTKAQNEAEKTGKTVDESLYKYEGPAPRSRETAILMLADSCEAATRANRPPNTEGIRKLVNKIIQARVDAGQLDNSGLTLADIETIKDTFVRSLKGMYHPRVKYPDDRKSKQTQEPAPTQLGTGEMPREMPIPALEDEADEADEAASTSEEPVKASTEQPKDTT